jgi:hypothetical protein
MIELSGFEHLSIWQQAQSIVSTATFPQVFLLYIRSIFLRKLFSFRFESIVTASQLSYAVLFKKCKEDYLSLLALVHETLHRKKILECHKESN